VGNLRTFFYSNSTIIILLIFLTFLIYTNILPNQLFYDDEELIYRNVYIQDLQFLPKYFTENMIAGAGKISNMYRPLLLTSFAIDYQIWKNNPFGFHLTSIILHALNSLLIFFLIYLLFKDRLLAILSSVFFIIHPVQTEAITYASGRTDPLYSFFTLLSLFLFLLIDKNIRLDTLGKKLPSYLYVGSLLFFILAILSKETAVILPLLLIAVSFIFKFKRDFKKNILWLSPFFIIDLIYIVLRLTVLNFSDTLNFYQAGNIYSSNLLVRLYTFCHVFFEYLGILIFPKDLIYSRDISYITNVLNPWTIAFLMIFTISLFLSVKNFPKNKLFLFSFCWFFIIILPVSGIIPINTIISEHYLYLPSVSFFLVVSYVFSQLIKYPNKIIKSFSIVFLLFLITVFSIRTIVRNFDWKDAVTFYTISLKQSPNNIPMRHNLAMTWADKGKHEEAIKEYQNIITLSDTYPQTHHNLANSYKAIGKHQEAEKEYYQALKMDQKFYFSYLGLADLYQKTQDKEKLEGIINILKKLNINRRSM